MKRKQSFLFTLLMAIVMMAMCPQMVWAQDDGGNEEPTEEEHVCNYSLVGSTEPNCDSSGYEEYACVCGSSYSNEFPPLGHSFDSVISDDNGHHHTECSTCFSWYMEDPCTYDSKGNCIVCGYHCDGYDVTVTIDGYSTPYDDIQQALAAAEAASSATLTLLQDIDLGNNGWEFTQGDVTLDLNGCTLKEAYGTIEVNGASLTITDTSDGGSGEVICTDGNALCISSGQLDIYGGTFISKGSTALFIGESGNTTVSIQGGRFTTESKNDGHPAILNISGLSLLVDGYAYYNTTTEQQLHEANGVVCEENGNFAKDVTVKALPTVPTFASLEELLAAGQDYDAVNVTIDDEVMVAMLNPEGAYMVALKNNKVLLQAPAPDPALNWPSGGRVTGTLNNVSWNSLDNLLHSDDASLWSNLTYTPGVVKEYNSIDELLADDIEQGTTVSVKINNKIAAIQNMDAGMSLIVLEKANGEEGIGLIGLIGSDSDLEAGSTLSGTLTNVTYGLMNDVAPALMALSTNILAVLDYKAPTGGSESSDVASVTIGETTTGYADFDEALAAALDAESATLTLLDDIQTENESCFGKGNVTLDLNGHSLSSENDVIWVNGGSLTITDTSDDVNGRVECIGSHEAVFAREGTLNILAGIFVSKGYIALYVDESTVTLSGGQFITNSTNDSEGAILIFKSSALAEGYAYYNASTDKQLRDCIDKFIMDVNGNPAKNVIVKEAGEDPETPDGDVASVTIGETTTGYADIQEALTDALNASSATLTLLQDINLGDDRWEFTKGDVTLDLNGYILESDYNDGIYVNGASLTITDTSDGGNGEVISTYANALYIWVGSLCIKDGTFISKKSAAFFIGESGNTTVSIQGGRFTTESEQDANHAIVNNSGLSLLADGYAYYNTATGQQLQERDYNIIDENGNYAKDVTVKAAPVASVTIGETTTDYANFVEALRAAKAASSATLTLLTDIDYDSQYTFNEGNVTLDLNGHSLSSENDVIWVNGGSLTITDTSDDANGRVECVGSRSAIFAWKGTLNIFAGTFVSEKSSALHRDASDNLTVTLSGGQFITNSTSDSEGAIIIYDASALAEGYAYYNASTDKQLRDCIGDFVTDEYGTPAKDVIVKEAGELPEIVVRGELDFGDNDIYIGEVTGNAFDHLPEDFNIYRFTAPADGTIIVSSIGNEDTYGVLYDANFNLLAEDDDSGEDRNFRIEYEVEEGSVYYIGVRELEGNEIGGYTICISQPELIDEMTIVDGTVYDGLNAGDTVAELTYQRSVSESQVGNWQALYIPFKMPVAELKKAGFDAAAINNFHEYTDEDGKLIGTDLEIKMLTSGTLKENWPYLIRPAEAGEKSIVLKDVTLAPAKETSISCSSIEREYTFSGTYSPMTGLYSEGYLFLNGGSLCTAANDNVTLKAQRWYLNIQDREGQLVDEYIGGNGDEDEDGETVEAKKRISLRVIGEDDASGIEEIRVITSKAEKNSAAGIYDIMGRKLSSISKGINIIRQSDGTVKKVLITK